MFLYHHDPLVELDRLFEDALAAQTCPRVASPSMKARRRRDNLYHPRLDLHESTDANTVTATLELPGLTSEGVAIDIDVHQNRLTISGESVVPESDEEKDYIIRERRSGKFSRTLRLPFGTKPEDVIAKMENGVLTISFPKMSPEQQAKRIVVQ